MKLNPFMYLCLFIVNNVSVTYCGSAGRDEPVSYDMEKVLHSEANEILSKFSNPGLEYEKKVSFYRIRNLALIDNLCEQRINMNSINDSISDSTFCSSGNDIVWYVDNRNLHDFI